MTLGPDARALLDAAAGGDEPSASDAARVRHKLATRLAVGAAAGAAAATLTKSAGGATAATGAGAAAGVGVGVGAGAAAGAGAAVPMSSLLGAKVLLAVALVGGATATGAVVMRERAPTAVVVPATSAPPKAPESRGIPTVAEVTGGGVPEATASLAGRGTDGHARAKAPSDGVPPSEKPVAAVNLAPDESSQATNKPANTPSAPSAPANAAPKTSNTEPHRSVVGSSSRLGSEAIGPTGNGRVRAGGSGGGNGTGGGSTSGASGAGGAGNGAGPGNGAVAANAPSGGGGGAGARASSGADSGNTSGAGNGAGAGDGPAEPARPATPPRDTVAEEAALLRAANAALAHGDAATALARVDEHAARFPRGALTEEREAARVLALCAAGRATESRAAASRFVSANPRSPFVAQVRRACTAP